jgi:hypothetical protein
MADIDEAIRSLRIITGGILMSLVATAAMAAFLRPQIASSITSEVQNALLGLSGLIAVGSAVAFFTFQRSIKTSLQASVQASRGSAEPLLGVLEPYRRLAILRAALVEAPGLVGLLTYLVGGSEIGLVIAAASVVLLASTMPSRESLQRFADGVRE